jgi:hypothetical protein
MSGARQRISELGFVTAEILAARLGQTASVSPGFAAVVGSLLVEDLMTGDEPDGLGSIAVRDRTIGSAVSRVSELALACFNDARGIDLAAFRKMVGNDPTLGPVAGWAIKTAAAIQEPISRRNAERIASARRRAIKRATALKLARKVMRSCGVPLHFREVADRVNAMRSKLELTALAVQSVHSVLQDEKYFSYVAQGTYGLRDWGDSAPFIKEAVVQVLEESGEPLTQGQVLEGVGRLREASENSVMMYLKSARTLLSVQVREIRIAGVATGESNANHGQGSSGVTSLPEPSCCRHDD